MAGGIRNRGFVGVLAAAGNVEPILLLNRAVSCMAKRGSLYVGGSFTGSFDNEKVAHILSTNGLVQGLGRGVDGTVNSITFFTDSQTSTEMLIVGGSFHSAVNLHSIALVKGALAAWNPATALWSAISEPFLGRVDVLVSNGPILYLAGTMSLGDKATSLLSIYDGKTWTTPLGRSNEFVVGGGGGGGIDAMAISDEGHLIIGGDFVLQGTSVYLARWDGGHFHKIQV